MKLLSTKFYPVDVVTQTIHIDPMDNAAAVKRKWHKAEMPMLAIRGANLMANALYSPYKLEPLISRSSLLMKWEDESKESFGLWKSVAQDIASCLRDKEPKAALITMKREWREFRRMSCSAFYGRAVQELKELISTEAQVA